MQSKYVNPSINQQLWEDGYYRTRFSTEAIEWRDYHSKWHKAFWDLMFHKHSSYRLLLDLNQQQAARIMELEHDLRVANRHLDFQTKRFESLKPEFQKLVRDHE